MWPLILIGVGVGWAAVANSKPTVGVMTPARRLVFQTALAKNPPLTGDQFMALAKEFDSYGLTHEAEILRRRARIRNLPPADRQKMLAAFQKGMASKDPVQVRALANAFETEGAFDSARQLRDYANHLDVALQVAQVADAKAAAASQSAGMTNALNSVSPASVATLSNAAGGVPGAAGGLGSVAGAGAGAAVSAAGSAIGGALPGPLGSLASAGAGAAAGAVSGAVSNEASSVLSGL